jgi:phosphoglycerol transferase MdoB-like AlkP superfamily enzyme
MKRIIFSFLRQLVFWILFFNLSRLIFLLYYQSLIRVEHIPFKEILGVFLFSFKLDLATACYLMLFPFLLLNIQSIWAPGWLNRVNQVYTGILIFFYSLSATAEMGIYAEWKTKLTYKVVKYLYHPSEIYNSAETATFFLLLLILTLLFLSGLFLYLKIFYLKITIPVRNFFQNLAFLLITPVFLFIGLRGGIQQIPINQSESYYSDHNILNIAAVNNAFNLYISIFENLELFSGNPYHFMDDAKARKIVDHIYHTPGDSTAGILTLSRPNIVLLILESWSADLVEELGGKRGITPEFSELAKKGILFNEIYASGSRSEQGMASLFGGFPSHPVSSITVQPDKFVKLPSLPRILKANGYSSSFYFGGQLIYGNIKSYIIYNQFDKIMEVYDFPKTYPRGKLGIHDEFTLGYLLQDLGNMKPPFFSALFTLSTHSPWDQPYPKVLTWGDNEREYINAAHYTDHCLGRFFREAEKKSWYDSTLFIIVADHGHNSYMNWHPESREYHRIPLLFLGGAIRQEYRGTVCSKLGNQHDIASTVLSQLKIGRTQFRWSKDLLNPLSPEFAYYTTEGGVGWVRRYGYFTYDRKPNFYYWWTDPKTPDSIINEGKAYLQMVFSEYLND